MKKLYLLMVSATAVLLTTCGEKKDAAINSEAEASVEAVRNGFMGEVGAEIMEYYAKMDTVGAGFAEFFKEIDKKEKAKTLTAADELRAEQAIKDIMSRREELKMQWDSRRKEVYKQAMGLEVQTEIDENVPLELVKPFAVTWTSEHHLTLTAHVKVTTDRPAIGNSAVKAQPDGYYSPKVVLIDNKGTALDTLPVTLQDKEDYIYYSQNSYQALKAGAEQVLGLSTLFEEDFFNAKRQYHDKCMRTVRVMSAKKFRIIWEHPVEEVNLSPGRGDLGGYDLRGPVKSVKCDDWNCTFNEQGQLMTENGQSLKRMFTGGVKRDKDGRLTECNADGYGSRYYTYNDKGLPTEIAEDGGGRTFTYDADGYVKTESMTVAPDMGDEEGEPEVITLTYTIVEKDSYGNWVKRKDQNGNITTRTITYFQ